jgi:hypothetical protein
LTALGESLSPLRRPVNGYQAARTGTSGNSCFRATLIGLLGLLLGSLLRGFLLGDGFLRLELAKAGFLE